MKKYTYTESKDTRSGFGDALTELGKSHPNVVALCADLIGSLKMDDFKKMHLADFVVFNDGKHPLIPQIHRLHQKLLKLV